MKYKYQLIILGSEVPEKDLILDQIMLELQNLNLPVEILTVITADKFKDEFKKNQPAFALYFGDVGGNFKNQALVKEVLAGGVMVLPIFFNEFKTDIPKELSNQNGILFANDRVNWITNTVLESFELLRSTRKVFISYKRNESTSVAIQLFESLEAHNFDVFLDTHSIGKGDAFQDELWHRMTDCDVILLLNTPSFLESFWCKEELAEAGAKQIGLVQLVWPNHKIKDIDASSHISYPVVLTANDFVNDIFSDPDNSKLLKDTVEIIVQKVESVRARNLAARQDSLITEFKKMAEKNGRTINVQPEKFLTEDRPDGQHFIYIPAIGIPQSTSCQSAEIKKELLGHANSVVRIIYDDIRIRDRWLKHLDWLNDNFKKDIKTLRKQNFETWLQTA